MLDPLHQRDANVPNVVTVEEFNGARQITKPNTEHKYIGISTRGSLYLTQNPQPALLNQAFTYRLILSLKYRTGFVFL